MSKGQPSLQLVQLAIHTESPVISPVDGCTNSCLWRCQSVARRGRENPDERLAFELAAGNTAQNAAADARVVQRTTFRRLADPIFKARVAELRGIIEPPDPGSQLGEQVRARVRAHVDERARARLAEANGHCTGGKLPGNPDFAWCRERVAVFVDGCFWHGHDCGRNLTPKNNATHWSAKFAATGRRDEANTRALRGRGWTVIRIWECKLRHVPDECVKRICRALQA